MEEGKLAFSSWPRMWPSWRDRRLCLEVTLSSPGEIWPFPLDVWKKFKKLFIFLFFTKYQAFHSFPHYTPGAFRRCLDHGAAYVKPFSAIVTRKLRQMDMWQDPAMLFSWTQPLVLMKPPMLRQIPNTALHPTTKDIVASKPNISFKALT